MEVSATVGCSHQTDLICTTQRGQEVWSAPSL